MARCISVLLVAGLVAVTGIGALAQEVQTASVSYVRSDGTLAGMLCYFGASADLPAPATRNVSVLGGNAAQIRPDEAFYVMHGYGGSDALAAVLQGMNLEAIGQYQLAHRNFELSVDGAPAVADYLCIDPTSGKCLWVYEFAAGRLPLGSHTLQGSWTSDLEGLTGESSSGTRSCTVTVSDQVAAQTSGPAPLQTSAGSTASQMGSTETFEILGSWGGPGGGGGLFNCPMGVAVDPAGNIYVADSTNKRVQLLGSDGQFRRMYGDTEEWPAGLDFPIGVALDGNFLYVVDAGDSSVAKFNLDGEFVARLTVTDSGLIGIAAANGMLYLTDHGGNRVVKIKANGDLIASWGGLGTAPGQFDYPSGIALDSAGNVYVVDVRNGRVQVFDPAGQLIRAFSCPVEANDSWPMLYGIAVSADGRVYVSDPRGTYIRVFSSDGRQVTNLSVKGYEAHGLAVDSNGRLLAAVRSFSTHAIRRYEGSKYSQFGAFGANGAGHLQFGTGLAVDPERGWVYVADFWDCRIQRFSLEGEFLSQWGSHGEGQSQFFTVEGISLDAAGNVYVCDSEHGCVKKFDTTGRFLLQFGRSGARNGEFRRPVGVAVDSAGNVYVSDMDRQVVQKFSQWGLYEDSWGSSGTGPGQFVSPRGIGVDSAGYVYVVDETGSDLPSRVQKFRSDGTYVMEWALDPNVSTGCPSLYSVAFDQRGNVWIVDTRNSVISVFTADGALICTADLGGLGCHEPQGMGLDAEGNVYVTSFDTGLVIKLALHCAE